MKKILSSVLCIAMAVMICSSAFVTPSFAASYPIKENSPLKGIDVGFYGDSICAANVENNTSLASIKGWAGRIGSTNQMVWTNHGVSGASVSNVRGTNTIYAQIQNVYKTSHEMLILHGGTNDAWDGAPVGTMTEGFGASNTYDVTTFAGGLEQLFAYIREKAPNATVGYIINFKFVNAKRGATKVIENENGKPTTVYLLDNMDEYVEMTKKICDKWGVPYLDLHGDDELTEKLHPKDEKGAYQSTYVYDFVHPSAEGYDILYPYIEEFMIDLITPDPVETDPVTEPVTEPVTTPVTDSVDSKSEGGCKSSAVGTVALITVISLAGATVFSKKKERE